MNKFLTTISVALVAGVCMAADISDQIRWYAGSFSTKVAINNMTVTSLGQLNGVFEAPDTQFQLNGDSFKAETTGPDNYSYSSTITQAKAYNSQTGGYEDQPAFRFNAASFSVDVPGEYTVSIPAGAFTINGEVSDAFSVVFTIVDNRNYQPVDLGLRVSPDPAVETADLRKITLTFNNLDNEGSRIYRNLGSSPTKKPTISKIGGEGEVTCRFEGTASTTSTITYTLFIPDGAIDGPGKYKITVPEGAIRLQGESSSTYYTNNAVSYTYSYTGTGSQDVAVSGDLKWYYGTSFGNKVSVNGELQSISMLYGMLENGKMMRVKRGRPQATISGPEGYYKETEITQCRTYDAISDSYEDQNGFQINAMVNGNTSASTPGEYVVSIPQGALTIDGYDNEAFTAKFTVKDNRNYVPADFNFDVRPNPADPELIALTYFNISLSRLDADGKVIYRNLGVKHNAKATIAKAGGETVELTFKSNEQATTSNISYKILFDEGQAFKAGIYTVTIPEGSMLIGSEGSNQYWTNKELKYVYKFEGSSEPTYTLTRPIIRPEQGSVKGLAGLQFETPAEGLEMMLVTEGTKFTLTLPDGTAKDCEVLTYPSNILMNIPFYTTYTTPGQYKFTVPRGALKYVDSSDGKEYYSTGFELVYDVTGGETVDMEYTLTTPDGPINTDRTNVYNINYVYVTFNEPVSPIEMIYSKVVYPDGSEHYARTTWSGANKRFLIDFSYPKTPGLYTVTVPQGICYNEKGEFNKAFTFELNLLDRNMVDLKCTVDPADGSTVDRLSVIKIDAPEGYSEIYPTHGGITMTYFYNDDTPDKRTMYYLSIVSKTRMQIVLDSDVTEIGDYTWYIPADAIRGIQNDGTEVIGNEMAFYWSVRQNGVVDIFGDEPGKLYNVYTTDGKMIMNQADSEALNRLPKGIYIINGRTYVIR